MNIESSDMDARRIELHSALRKMQAREPAGLALIASAAQFAEAALRGGRVDLAIETFELLVERAPHHAHAWRSLGFAYGEQQRIPEAMRAFAAAASLQPEEPVAALAHAQATLDAGFDASQLFEHAHRLVPDNLATVSGWAASLGAQGKPAAAKELLARALLRHPDWLVGQRQLAVLRVTDGEVLGFDSGYEVACSAQPHNLTLRLAWFGALAQARDWDKALRILAAGEKLIGAAPAFAAARAFAAGESADPEQAETLFSQLEGYPDDVLRIAHLRHCLRTQQMEKAERIALGLMQGASAQSIWPYLSLIWRIRGDARWQWLDGAPPYIRAFDLGLSAAELDQLATVLRLLHTARGASVEQSVRGGTQTDPDRQLLFRAEPEIQAVRAKIEAAIREYISGLPAPVAGHPLLGMPRGRILYSGSWSVRLTGQGFHVSHTHPRGWISSALYIALPSTPGPAPAGWINFGTAPAGLGLALPGYVRIEPKPGRLVLFPSTMWHETLPFEDGERLVIAFDVMRPKIGI